MKLTTEDLQKLHTKQVANIIRKLGAGKTITKREEEILASERDRAPEIEQGTNLASTWDELAQMLSERSGVSITRRAIQDWRNDPRYEAKWPRPRGDRHDVQEWIVFMQRFGLKRADEAAHPDDVPEDRMTVRDWKGRREELMCEKLEREILRDDGKLLVATEIEIALGQLIAGVSVALDHFAPGASRFVVGLRDIHDVQAKLQSEIDAVKQHINAARYMDDCVEEVAQAFPFDPETEALYKRVLEQRSASCAPKPLRRRSEVRGQKSVENRGVFVEMVRCATTAALRAIGRRALQSTAHSVVAPSDEPRLAASPTKKESSSRAETPDTSVAATACITPPPRKRRALTRTRKRARSPAPKAK